MSAEENGNGTAIGDRDSKIDYTYIFALLVVAAIGELFSVFFVVTTTPWTMALHTLATITGVALAALMAGGLIGFLFGIPRRQQSEGGVAVATGTEPTERSLYAANTNLEQISDWLTKIIVGVTLVELLPIVDFVSRTGSHVAASIGMADKPAFPISIIVLYVICGFMIGYLWARLYLMRALDAAERVSQLKASLNKLTKQSQTDSNAISLIKQQLGDETDERPTSERLAAAVAPASTETKAYIFHLAENLRWKTWRDRKGVMERTIPVFRALVGSDKEGVYHRNLGQLAYALKDQRVPDWVEAERYFSKAIELRGDATENDWHAYEANRAICRIRLDEAFKQNKPTDSVTRDRIVGDLRIALDDDWTREWLEKDNIVLQWAALNAVVLNDLIEDESEAP